MGNNMFRQKHTIMFWFWSIFIIFFAAFLCVGLVFGFVTRKTLLTKTIEETGSLFEVYAEETDGSLETINQYMYQTLLDSDSVRQLERDGTKTEMAFAQKEISDSIMAIMAWDENVDSILFYSPEGSAGEVIEVGKDSDYKDRQILKEQIREYIDVLLEQQVVFQKDYVVMPVGDTAYLVRIYKINNSYACAAVRANHLLDSISGHLEDEGAVVFLADADGEILKSSDAGVTDMELAENGSEIEVNQSDYVQVYYQAQDGGYYLGTLFPVSMLYQRVRLVQRLFWVMLFVLLLVIPMYMLVIRRMIVKPVREIEHDMSLVGNGDWEILAKNYVRVREFDRLAKTFNDMVVRIRELKIDNYEKELAAKKSELQYLQMQNKPHFYLNALNIIYSLAQVKDYKLIQKMTMALVNYLRYTFQDMSTLVMLNEELRHVQSYIEIQQMRFSDSVDYVEDVPEELRGLMVPPFVIQSFIENSVKYALRHREQNLLCITASRERDGEDDFLVLQIRDNGEGYDPESLAAVNEPESPDEDKKYHVGIRNVRERLHIIYGDKAKLELSNDNGAVTTIFIPVIGDDLT